MCGIRERVYRKAKNEKGSVRPLLAPSTDTYPRNENGSWKISKSTVIKKREEEGLVIPGQEFK